MLGKDHERVESLRQHKYIAADAVKVFDRRLVACIKEYRPSFARPRVAAVFEWRQKERVVHEVSLPERGRFAFKVEMVEVLARKN